MFYSHLCSGVYSHPSCLYGESTTPIACYCTSLSNPSPVTSHHFQLTFNTEISKLNQWELLLFDISCTLPANREWPGKSPATPEINMAGSMLNTEFEREGGERIGRKGCCLSAAPSCVRSLGDKAAGPLLSPFWITCLPATFKEHVLYMNQM